MFVYFLSLRIPLLFIFIVLSQTLNAQNVDGAYSGNIKCGKKEFEARLFIYSSPNDFFYVKYLEFSNRKDKKDILTEFYGRGRYPNPVIELTTVVRLNKNNPYIVDFDTANKYTPKFWRFDFSVANQVKLGLGFMCSGGVTTRDKSLDEEYKQFLAEIQPKLEEDKWQTTFFGLKYRVDDKKRHIFRIDSSEWIMFGYHENTRLFVPYPYSCNNLSPMVVITDKGSITSSPNNLAMALAGSQYNNHNYLRCAVPNTIVYKAYNSYDVPSNIFRTYYTYGSHFRLIEGEPPDFSIREFTCGELKSTIDNENERRILISAPDKNYFKEHNSEFSCLLDKNLKILRPQAQIIGYDIEIITRVGEEVIQKNILRRSNNYAINIEYDAAVEATPLKERINLFNSRISNAQYLECIHYGLFEDARQLMLSNHLLSSAAFTYYQIRFQNVYSDFLSVNAVRVPVQYTRTMVDNFGLPTPLKNEVYHFDIEPEYVKSFTNNLNSLIAIQNWEGLLYISGNRASNIIDDIRNIVSLYHPESRIAYRFKENLYRYITGLPPYKPGDPIMHKPQYSPRGELIRTDTLELENFFYEHERHAGLAGPAAAFYAYDIQKGRIQGKILVCEYKSEKGNTYYRYFWYKEFPENLQEKIKYLSPGNPLINEVGPPLIKPPKDLNSAVKIMVEYLY